jgi:hypothetical protein
MEDRKMFAVCSSPSLACGRAGIVNFPGMTVSVDVKRHLSVLAF